MNVTLINEGNTPNADINQVLHYETQIWNDVTLRDPNMKRRYIMRPKYEKALH